MLSLNALECWRVQGRLLFSQIWSILLPLLGAYLLNGSSLFHISAHHNISPWIEIYKVHIPQKHNHQDSSTHSRPISLSLRICWWVFWLLRCQHHCTSWYSTLSDLLTFRQVRRFAHLLALQLQSGRDWSAWERKWIQQWDPYLVCNL